ncbi:MAG: hypothetical protein HFF01_07210 [Erysipelotrichaceae bacterium]|nr:hypothetical protein [Erysipelotrichaceae bacterium]
MEKVECALLETKIVTNDGNVTQKEFDDAINTLNQALYVLDLKDSSKSTVSNKLVTMDRKLEEETVISS